MSKIVASKGVNEKSERIMKGVALWCSFYRENPHRFVEDYLNINLKLFQKILLFEMVHNNYTMYVASRGQGKTFLTSIFITVMAILYPGIKIVVVSGTKKQSREVLEKITDDLMKNYDWGSANLKREITKTHIAENESFVNFTNGSWIKVAAASDNSRGMRANILVVDEFRLVDLDAITSILKYFLSAPRQPRYLSNPQYAGMLERNKEIYLSSSWLKSHWSYEKVQSYLSSMMDDKRKYFICGLPYQICIKEGLLSREQIEDEMCSREFNETKFAIEMETMWLGDDESAFFKFENLNESRKLQTAVYPPNLLDKDSKIPHLALNERRILSVDVALMASTRHKNDASSIMINSAIPKNNNTYSANLIFMESLEGLKAEELALAIRRLFSKYKCTDLVLDCAGQGLPIFDILCSDMVDYETGEVYPALSCCNDKDMEARCTVDGAAKVIWSIKATAAFNSQAALALRNGFQSHNINLLVSETEADNILKSKIKNYMKYTPFEQAQLKMPYVQTSLLVYELINLECEVVGTNIKITEKSGKRKDRFSCLMYNYWVQCQIERDTLKRKQTGFDAKSFASQLQKFNHKPVTY